MAEVSTNTKSNIKDLYVVIKLEDDSEIYDWGDEHACSHECTPHDEFGSSCDNCTMILRSFTNDYEINLLNDPRKQEEEPIDS